MDSDSPFKAKMIVPDYMILNKPPARSTRRRNRRHGGAPPSEMSRLLEMGKTLFFPGLTAKDRGISGRFSGRHSYLYHRNFKIHTMVVPNKGLYIWAEKKGRTPKVVAAAPVTE